MGNDEGREQWVWHPLVAVGPLEFGMRPYEVAEALGQPGGRQRLGVANHEYFGDSGVTAYYTEAKHLAAVALCAVQGPQVVLGEIPLVGQVPSQTAKLILGHVDSDGLEACWTPSGHLALSDAGLFLHGQRAGDIVLTRPLFLFRGWTGDYLDEFIPDAERFAGC
ncbi:hypothetical protein [Streptomyces sp. NRRL S-448]|uniref:hypothetical protein n=1 Tax=Streptomyces sp. NRRL S-448 TaxID=1463907 RepID=UPI00356A3CA9